MERIEGLVIAVGLVPWFCLVFAILVFRLSRRGVALRGMMYGSRGGSIRLHRVQSLVVTLLFAVVYPVVALWPGHERGLPDIPLFILMVMAVSQGVFVGGNALTR